MVRKLNEENQERVDFLKQTLDLKDDFAGKRHGERVELIEKRLSCACKLLDKRDVFATKRHTEKLELTDRQFSGRA